jgi:hypothetical protein
MLMQLTRKGFRTGSTLISSMIAVAIILIAIIGTSNFRYYTALDTRKATAQTEAARIALLLCESWRGVQGDLTYNPITNLGSDLTISENTGPQSPADFTKLGSYLIQLVDNSDQNYKNEYHISYYVTMSWKDIQSGLRALNVTISWAQRDMSDGGYDKADKSFTLTIYTLTS